MDDPGLQWLPEHIQHVPAKLCQLVAEEHAVVRQADLPGPDRRPTSDEAGVTNRMMRSPERASRHQWRPFLQNARDRVHASGLDCFGQSEWR